jgi:hypothetical protein
MVRPGAGAKPTDKAEIAFRRRRIFGLVGARLIAGEYVYLPR